MLGELEQEGLVLREESKVVIYRLAETTTAFAGIARQYLTTARKFNFLESKYARRMINSELMKYIKAGTILLSLRRHVLVSSS